MVRKDIENECYICMLGHINYYRSSSMSVIEDLGGSSLNNLMFFIELNNIIAVVKRKLVYMRRFEKGY